jgi:hypothetical protein
MDACGLDHGQLAQHNGESFDGSVTIHFDAERAGHPVLVFLVVKSQVPGTMSPGAITRQGLRSREDAHNAGRAAVMPKKPVDRAPVQLHRRRGGPLTHVHLSRDMVRCFSQAHLQQQTAG